MVHRKSRISRLEKQAAPAFVENTATAWPERWPGQATGLGRRDVEHFSVLCQCAALVWAGFGFSAARFPRGSFLEGSAGVVTERGSLQGVSIAPPASPRPPRAARERGREFRAGKSPQRRISPDCGRDQGSAFAYRLARGQKNMSLISAASFERIGQIRRTSAICASSWGLGRQRRGRACGSFSG